MYYKISLAVVLLSLYTASGSEEFTNTDSTNDESFSRVRRGGFSMLRLGRGLQMLRLGKRALPMLRMGRSGADSLSEEDLQYLFNLMRNDRQVPLPRYGKDLAFQYMLMNALKNAELNSAYDEDIEPRYGLGYDLESTNERQIRPAPRPGRYRRSTDKMATGSDDKTYVGADQVYDDIPDLESEDRYDDDLSARVAPLMRYGKYVNYDLDDEADVDKRAMRMLRLGRGMRMLRLGKRPMTSDLSEDVTEADKRALRLLRLGKRPKFAMLRMGRGDMEEEKRALRLLRLGKKSDADES
ncbi:myomodulin neuropeptides 1-like [Mercenaria mercenaria]|uniref:myomodulin neuropeptides 1-like n=1 Tax=Mercenaria mercenaria TaxID=6596 RepID=UPI00234EF924|nr:myomodulin neuropeptides 1-like [Mercenaria mercenaria]